MLSFSQLWTSLPNDAYRPMLIDATECSSLLMEVRAGLFEEVSGYFCDG